MIERVCPNCKGTNLYRSKEAVSPGGGYAPNFLPRLGRFFKPARFTMVVCADCGLTRFFANDHARHRLAESRHWTRA